MTAPIPGRAKPIASDLTISIINHSNPELLRDCLRSLYAGTHAVTLDVWVIDNATDGRLVEEIQAEFPQVRWLFNERRQGFSANHNQVLCQTTARYACILNDDTVIHDSAFDTLVGFLDGNPKVGMCGAKLVNADGSIQDCAFHSMTLLSELIGICFLPASLCFLKSRHVAPAQYHDQACPVDWVLGACIVARTSALERVGLLDSAAFPIANNEEADWCLRAWKSGWQVAYCPEAVITHFGGQSLKWTTTGADKMRIEMYRTRITYFRKHMA